MAWFEVNYRIHPSGEAEYKVYRYWPADHDDMVEQLTSMGYEGGKHWFDATVEADSEHEAVLRGAGLAPQFARLMFDPIVWEDEPGGQTKDAPEGWPTDK